MDEHTDRVEADLQRYYGVDLRDLFRGSLSWRRLGALVASLPPQSALVSAIVTSGDAVDPGDGRPHGWSISDYLLAAVVDAVNVNTWTLRQVNSKSKVKPPPPLPRPGERRAVVRRLTPEDRERIRRRNRGG